MRKLDELTDVNSCLSKARDSEMLFVLLGRDPAAPVAIRVWCEERLRLKKNQPDDQQIKDALDCALVMECDSPRGVKPPLGLMPHGIWVEHRVKEIFWAIQRYLEAKKKVPAEWIAELGKLTEG